MSLLLARFTAGRVVALSVTALLIACVLYGFTASNTVPNGNVGDGAGTISGYTISNVAYDLNVSNPSNIDAAGFDVTGVVKPSTVKVRLVTTGGSWYDCTSASVTSPYAYTCPTISPQLTTTAADQLRVVAAD